MSPVADNADIPLQTVVVPDFSPRQIVAAAQPQSSAAARRAGVSSALADVPVSAGVINGSGEWVIVNSALARLLGQTDAALATASVEDSTHEADREAWRSALHRVWCGDTDVVRTEQRLLQRNGRAVWCELTMRANRDRDAQRSAVVYVHDISTLRHAQETSEFLSDASRVLSESLDVDELLTIIPRLVVPRLADWCIIDLAHPRGGSLRATEIAGADPVQERALRALRARTPWEPGAATGALSRALRTGASRLFRLQHGDHLRAATQDAAETQTFRELGAVSLMIVPLAARAHVLGVLTLGRSQPDREHTDDDLETAEEFAASAALALDNAVLYREARHAEHSRDDLLSFIGHDLRAPLAVALLSARRLHEAQDYTEREAATTSLVDAATTATTMIDDLLDVTQIELGHLRIEADAVRVHSLLTSVLESHREVAQSRGVLVSLDVTQVAYVHADGPRASQALSRILENAIQFTPSGGTVTVSARECGDDIVFSVSDSGRGIPPEELPHLFNRRWEGARRGYGASGNGLALVKGIVDAHGGHVSVESQVGVGTTVTFSLPAWRRGSARAAPVPLPPRCVQRSAEPARVLIADHRPMVRAMLHETLAQAPHVEVLGEAVTGGDVLEQARAQRPGVVMLDLHLAGADAVDIIANLTSDAIGTRVLVLVGPEEDEAVSEAFGAGARGFLRHSASRDDVIGAVRAVARGELHIDPSLGDRDARDASAAQCTPHGAAHGSASNPEVLEILSTRERDVLMLAAQGFTAWQSGERLNLSPKTVETYRSRAMRKLGIESRAELVSFALHAGLFSA